MILNNARHFILSSLDPCLLSYMPSRDVLFARPHLEAMRKTVKVDVDVAGRAEGLFHLADDGLDLIDEDDARGSIGAKRRR